MNWCQRMEDAYRACETCDYVCTLRFRPPASEERVAELESSLGVKVPLELKGVLSETDGVMDAMEIQGKWIETGWLMWPVDEIEKWNLWFRSDAAHKAYDRSFDDLLFFAGAGVDGILFAFAISSGRVEHSDIYIWYPIEGVVKSIAPSLEAFVERWFGGKLSV